MHASDITFDFAEENHIQIHNNVAEPWKVTVVDTGQQTMTGGRIKKIQKYIPENESFMLTYGDGVSDVNLIELVDFHKTHGKYATVTAIQPGGRFGVMNIDDNNQVKSFEEKPKEDGNWISGGFFVLNHSVFDYIEPKEDTIFEFKPMQSLAEDNQMAAYRHRGFWHPMDTLRDKNYLEDLWSKGDAPWKVWND